MKNLITVSALLLGSQVTAFSQEQPNIVMLFVDDLGWLIWDITTLYSILQTSTN